MLQYLVLVQSKEHFQYGDKIYGPFSLKEANLFSEKDCFYYPFKLASKEDAKEQDFVILLAN